MLSKAFGGCQRRTDCVTVCFLVPPPSGPPSHPISACSFGLFPKISTPVEKTVEIPRVLLGISALGPVCEPLLFGHTSKSARIRALSPSCAFRGPGSFSDTGGRRRGQIC